MADVNTTKRLRFNISGTVQGVGFRPTIYRLAKKLQLTGFVCNNETGVCVEIQGKNVNQFLPLLKQSLPPLAKIDHIEQKNILFIKTESTFIISKSKAGNTKTKITPDVSICDACLNELFDSTSRYYLYPFINCTHCGPRYSITKKLPYDRKNTSMNQFTMCNACKQDYKNPTNRRYHAQPIACKFCGPQLSHSFAKIAATIKAGKIIALKTLGGFQLIADATNANAVQLLRQRKQRPQKPFALMTLNTTCADHIVKLNHQATLLLNSRERPIVLLPRKNNLPENIAPKLNSLGIMLPYTPLHYLLFYQLLNAPAGLKWLQQKNELVLLVTSANISDEPLIKDNNVAANKLNKIADLTITYDRNIITPIDDSVMTLIENRPFFIRRARGFTPTAIPLACEIPPTLALGAYLKNTICITRGNEAFVSQHLGDLNNPESIKNYHAAIKHLLQILAIKPQGIARDYHPNFYSSQLANSFSLPIYKIQHHHAHLAAVAAENQLTEPALGLALDGFGLGDDDESWGGELLIYETKQFKRVGSLLPLLQPGGEKATHEPWRMAASILFALNKANEIPLRFAKHPQAKRINELLIKKVNCPATSSCGCLFGAASALLGIGELNTYEGEAAMQLESMVSHTSVLKNGWKINNNELDLLPLFQKLLNIDTIAGANLFHGTLIAALTAWLAETAQQTGINNILLAGGCFLNKVLTQGLSAQLNNIGYKVYLPRLIPPNDGGISLGQAWIAGNYLLENTQCV